MTSEKRHRRDRMGGPVIERRVAFQALIVGLGAASVGRLILACTASNTDLPPRENLPSTKNPTDGDEYVPGQSAPVDTGDEAPKVPKQEWESRVKQLEAEQTRQFGAAIFTAAAPGRWVGKERSHVPQATVMDENGKKKVVVVVQHVMGTNALDSGTPADAGQDAAMDASMSMDAGLDAGDASLDSGVDSGNPDATPPPIHYITTIYLRADVNGTDTVVGLWEFASTDAAPPTVKFTLPAGVTAVTAFEWCTLHGLWASTPLPIP